MRKRALLALLLAATLALSGCVRQITETPPPEDEMREISFAYEAPQGDTVAPRVLPTVLYYLSQDASYLVAATAQVEVQSGQTQAEAALRELLSNVPDGMRAVAPAGVELQRTSGAVRISGNVCTVRLSASARSLQPQELFTLRLAITNTLTELSGIEYVAVLVEGREEGLDLAATVPSGAMSHYAGGDVGALWAQQAVLLSSSSTQGLSKAVPLYLPAQGARYAVPQVRNIVFPGTTEADYITGILAEMGKNPGTGQQLVVENLDTYLDAAPEIVTLEEGSERVLRLSFTAQVETAMMRQGIGRGLFLTMLTQTLMGFVPRVDAMQVYIDGQLIESLDSVDTVDFQPATYLGGLLRYDDFVPYVGAYIDLRFPVQDQTALAKVRRAVPFAQASMPRAMLRQWIIGLLPGEEEGLLPALPPEITDADILAVQLVDDLALVNLSSRFGTALREAGEPGERLMVFSLVNLLCSLPQVQRVAIFVEGMQPQAEEGLLDYRGVFYPNPGLERK